MTDITSSEFVSLLFYGSLALWIAMAIPRLFRGRFMSGVAALSFWVVAFLVVLTGYAYRSEIRGVAERVMATIVPGVPIASGPREVTVVRAGDGGFLVHGQAGATRLTFVLDTGASAVVLKAEDAARAGLKTRALDYTIDVSTANGRAVTAAATLPSLSVGGITERDVPILVAKAGALQENLLGLTFLDRLASFTVADDKLILRGR